MIIATASIKGQVPIIWTANGERHTVQYGHDETVGISERDACAAFLSCLEHARQSAGLDDPSFDTATILKTVDYFGHAVRVPEWADYIACDADGCIYVYDTEPEMGIDNWCCGPDRYQRVHHSYGAGPCPFWHQSLKEVNS